MGTISLAIHVTAAALFVGPQILMFFAVIPATWLIEDNEKLRRQVTRVVAARFGMLAMIAIVLLVVTACTSTSCWCRRASVGHPIGMRSATSSTRR